jgi:hypothetical protein
MVRSERLMARRGVFDAAVAYVRDRYDRHAIETPFQRRFVRQLQRHKQE